MADEAVTCTCGAEMEPMREMAAYLCSAPNCRIIRSRFDVIAERDRHEAQRIRDRDRQLKRDRDEYGISIMDAEGNRVDPETLGHRPHAAMPTEPRPPRTSAGWGVQQRMPQGPYC